MPPGPGQEYAEALKHQIREKLAKQEQEQRMTMEAEMLKPAPPWSLEARKQVRMLEHEHAGHRAAHKLRLLCCAAGAQMGEEVPTYTDESPKRRRALGPLPKEAYREMLQQQIQVMGREIRFAASSACALCSLVDSLCWTGEAGSERAEKVQPTFLSIRLSPHRRRPHTYTQQGGPPHDAFFAVSPD
jgi:hypothetical protein